MRNVSETLKFKNKMIKIKFPFIFLVILNLNCLYIVPKNELNYIFFNDLQPIYKNTIIIYKYDYLNLYSSNPYINNEFLSNRLKNSIRKAFETKFRFENLAIVDSETEVFDKIDTLTKNQNVIYLNITTNTNSNNDYSIKFLKFLYTISFGTIPYWKHINFNIKINSTVFQTSNEFSFQYSFIECGGWLTLPFIIFYENYWELRNKYHNSSFPEIEYMLSDSLSKIPSKQ
ncbi:hypothetical protein AB3N58_10210 [Leptospira sp. WS60.C2]